jgi:hypothetical protein
MINRKDLACAKAEIKSAKMTRKKKEVKKAEHTPLV